MRITVLLRTGTETALGFSQEVRKTGIKYVGVHRPLKVPQSTAGSDLDHLPREQMLTGEGRAATGRPSQRSAEALLHCELQNLQTAQSTRSSSPHTRCL